MKSLAFGFLCAVVAVGPAMGADRYQLLPIAQAGSPIRGVEYNSALVIDLQGDGVFACVSSLQNKATGAVLGGTCLKQKIDKGSVPPGPAAVPPAIVPWNDQISFWKIDATSGDVTFCGSVEQAKVPQNLECITFALPK
jgi:hypothetical protein